MAKRRSERTAPNPDPEKLAMELRLLGDDLDTTLRRIQANLAWVHRDLRALRTHVLMIQDKIDKGATP